MNLELTNLKLFAGSVLAIALSAGCESDQVIGVNAGETGGSNPAQTGGAKGTGGANVGGGNATGGTNATGGSSSNSDVATSALTQCGISIVGSPSVGTVDLPSSLTGPDYGVKASACQQSGWDLSQCAGQSATFTSYDTGTTDQWGSITAWVVSIGSKVCCVYESDDSNPGILAAPCENKPVTCTSNGQTYAVGDTVGLCMCLPDGTIGHCTGALLGCIYLDTSYAVGTSFNADCGSCVCQSDYTWGSCTGDCVGLGFCGSGTEKARYASCSASVDEATCTSAGGAWTGIVISGQPTTSYYCDCPTGDEGCACSNTNDCMQYCYYPSSSTDSSACNANPVGQCGKRPSGCSISVNSSQCSLTCVN